MLKVVLNACKGKEVYMPYKDFRFWIVAICGLWIVASVLASLWHFGHGPGLIVLDAAVGAVGWIVYRKLRG